MQISTNNSKSIYSKTRMIIFGISIIFIGIAVFSLALVVILPYEFANGRIQNYFYGSIVCGVPIAVLYTLFGTIRSNQSKNKKWLISLMTIFISIISFICLVLLFLSAGFGAWATVSILYRHKTEKREIMFQLHDIGAFGYNGHRIVEIKPILHFWVLPTPIDTNTLNKSEWKFVDEEGDIKFP